jgi:hypothetical protein
MVSNATSHVCVCSTSPSQILPLAQQRKGILIAIWSSVNIPVKFPARVDFRGDPELAHMKQLIV